MNGSGQLTLQGGRTSGFPCMFWQKTVFGGNIYRVRDRMARLFFREDAVRYMGSKMAIWGPGTDF